MDKISWITKQNLTQLHLGVEVIGKDINQSTRKQDLIHIGILVAIALVIGVYLIVTTVLISKDGVFYIERAQQFTSDPARIIKAHPPGYPFLIMTAHKCAALFTDDSSVFTWIYSAQSVTLLCRLLAIIPLYFMGKLLVGSKNSFWGMLILIFLPFPTRVVCDVVREWPYILFLATGFFFLLWSAKSGKWWLFGFVGLSCGLGYWIRSESAQLIIYGLLWAGVSLFRPKLWGVTRWENLAALVLLFIGFAIPAAPYMKCKGEILPTKVRRIIQSFSINTSQDVNQLGADALRQNHYIAEMVPEEVLKTLGEIFGTVGETLMWFFMLPIVLGLFYHFRNNPKTEDIFLLSSFIFMNILMMILRYCYFQPHVSQRWSLPLAAFTIFYVPVGLQVVGNWLDSKRSQCNQKTDLPEKKRLSWFLVLALVGISICIPKLLRPVGINKQGYREAANWLSENTANEAIIFEPDDNRVSFYAERKRRRNIRDSEYIVSIVDSPEGQSKFNKKVEEVYSVWTRKKKKRVVIYEVL